MIEHPAEDRNGERESSGHGPYGPGASDEVTVPQTDPVREARRRDLDDPAHVDVGPEELRDGGPTTTGGVPTTTGGSAGPASVPRRADHDDETDDEAKVAPTTTGDATSGAMRTPAGGSTSDAGTGGATAGDFTDH